MDILYSRVAGLDLHKKTVFATVRCADERGHVAEESDRLEAETIEHLLHRDLGTQPGEVNPGHGFLPAPVFAHRRTAEDRSVPSFL